VTSLCFLQGKGNDDDDEEDNEDEEEGKKRGEASPLDLATALVEAALAAGSTDNITAVVCKLRGMPPAGAAAAAAAGGDKKPKSAHANGHDGKKHTTGDAAKATKGGGNGHGHGHGGNKQEKRAKSSHAGEHNKRPTEKRAGNRIDFV